MCKVPAVESPSSAAAEMGGDVRNIHSFERLPSCLVPSTPLTNETFVLASETSIKNLNRPRIGKQNATGVFEARALRSKGREHRNQFGDTYERFKKQLCVARPAAFCKRVKNHAYL